MRICSLLPSATEILFALGLGDQIVGVSHECDFPPEALTKPIVIKSRVSHSASAAEIDRQVREFLARGESLYSVDLDQLSSIEPDLIVTQDLCHVCAATPDDLAAALARFERRPRVVTLNPHSLDDVCADICRVGEATGRAEEASTLVAQFQSKIADLERSISASNRPRALCLEWLDPPYVAGHWVPEMVERAGGTDVLGRAGKPSFRVDWETILATRPDVIFVMPCGYTLAQAEAEFRNLVLPQGWSDLSAVRRDKVFVVEASAYFSRPGPRLPVGLAILAQAIHAEKSENSSLQEPSAIAAFVRIAAAR